MLMQNFGVTTKEHYGMLWYFLEWSIALSLHNNKKSFSSAVDHVFRFAFVSVLIIHERI